MFKKIKNLLIESTIGSKKKYFRDEPNILSERLKSHLESGNLLTENIFRYGSESYFELIKEARIAYNEGNIALSPCDVEIVNSDIGEKGIFEGEEVWLDIPYVVDEEIISEAEYQGKKVSLGKPKRGGSKAYYVYVKGCLSDKSKVKKIPFGSGMKSKLSNPEARKRYNARHGCSKGRHNDKCKAGYYSCRLPRYAKSLGLSGGGTWW